MFPSPGGTPNYNAVRVQWFNDPTAWNNTRMHYFASEPEVLKKRDFVNNTFAPIDNSTFFRASKVFKYDTWVRGFDTNTNIKVLFERPIATGTSSNVVSLMCNYKYRLATSFEFGRFYTDPAVSYRYGAVSSATDFSALTSYAGPWDNNERGWSTDYNDLI